MRLLLWLATLLFFVAFFTYGYWLWRRSQKRRNAAQPSREP
jgi:hypothetical protein